MIEEKKKKGCETAMQCGRSSIKAWNGPNHKCTQPLSSPRRDQVMQWRSERRRTMGWL